MTQKEIVLLMVGRDHYHWKVAQEVSAHRELLGCWWAAAFGPAGAEITVI